MRVITNGTCPVSIMGVILTDHSLSFRICWSGTMATHMHTQSTRTAHAATGPISTRIRGIMHDIPLLIYPSSELRKVFFFPCLAPLAKFHAPMDPSIEG